jgi:hypothetical protein
MKNILFGMAGLGVGGAALIGMDSPDFDRTINRPPSAVYAAFSALAAEGTRSETAADGSGRTATIRVDKTRGESIHYEILLDDRPVVTADLAFAAAEDGRATRMTAELDIDAYELGSAFETEAGVALSLIPDSFIDRQFASALDDMVKDIEAGRPLPALGLARSGFKRSGSDSADVRTRRYQAEADRRAASRPTTEAAPMLDPTRTARDHVNGRN